MKKSLMCVALSALLAAPLSASAYELGPTFPGKWGSPTFGTPATVTWSLMGGGVSCELEFSGCKTTALDSFMPTGYLEQIRLAFDAWSKVAGLTFKQVADDGAAFDAASTASGDIRIGAHHVDGVYGTLAFTYFPPINGRSAAGDMFLDTAENWTIGFDGPGFDVFQVVSHEIGHAIGLEHVTGVQALMNSVYSEAFRGPQADDIAGARFLYGPPAPIPEPAALLLFTAGLAGVAVQRRRVRAGAAVPA
ncbi:matrixin family metalloprotease [uncultured Azohydromonas sp.]|uniref:matrixin family metalloprotease n=1 Tax=uncultured Azohydromonas sp. TaxID=487342 RepID=UPI0026047E68|nr:matrixin family metalloprotease [uncultured Azohydromonas sp.]